MRALQLILTLCQVALIFGAEIPQEEETSAIELKTSNEDEGNLSEAEDVSLEALCQDQEVKLFRLSQLDELVAESETIDESECSNRTIPALKDLQAIIKEDEDDVCTMHKVELYEQFYYKYLNFSLHDKDFQPLPGSLRKFVLAYGLQLANACKWNIYNELTGRVRDLLSADDYEQVAKYIHRKSPTVRLVGSTRYPDELFLPVDLLGPELASEQSEWALSEGPARRNLENLKRRCELRFQPIYQPLMMPVARLAQLGFNYRDEKLQVALSEASIKQELGRWPRVVFLCELVKNIKLVSAEAGELKAEELPTGDENVMNLDRDEVSSVSSLDGEIGAAGADIEPIDYVGHFIVKLNETIIEPTDKALPRAIFFTFTFLDSKWKLRLRQLSNFLAIMKDHLRHFRFHSIIAKLVKFFWWHQDFWFGFKNKNDEVTRGIERQLDLETYLLKYDDRDLTQTQKVVRFARKGLHLTFKTTFTALMVLLTFCLIIC